MAKAELEAVVVKEGFKEFIEMEMLGGWWRSRNSTSSRRSGV